MIEKAKRKVTTNKHKTTELQFSHGVREATKFTTGGRPPTSKRNRHYWTRQQPINNDEWRPRTCLLGGSPAASKQMFRKQTPLLRSGRASLVTLFSHAGTSTTPCLCARRTQVSHYQLPPTPAFPPPTSSVLRCPPRPLDGSENRVMSSITVMSRVDNATPRRTRHFRVT